MVRTITKIKDLSILSQGDDKGLKSIQSIDFDDIEIGAGGFGKIHSILSIDGKQSGKYVIKIFSDKENESHAYDTIEKLHVKLKKNEVVNNIPSYIERPELLGLPFVAFRGYDEIEEVEVTAFIMFDLNKLGFIDYGSENTDISIYRSMELPDKIFIGQQLAHTVSFLHNIKFIHSDLKEAAIWYHPDEKQLAIIDYDSGYHFDTQEKPSTLGAIGHWISGGLRNIISSDDGNKERSVKERLREEHWVLANALFELIFGVMPYFFLKDSEDSTKRKYLKKNKWPEIDEGSSHFLKENKVVHTDLLNVLSNLREAGLDELIDNFSNVFNDGYSNSSIRISSAEWDSFLMNLTVLLGVSSSIENFTSDKKAILEKDEVVNVFFKTKYSRYISIDKIYYSPILHKTASIICKTKENQIKLIAYNLIGSSIAQININAEQREPIIKQFKISKVIRDTKEPLTLSWKTGNIKKVTISNIDGEFDGNTQINVEPTSEITYKLTAYGYFDELLEKEITVDVIKPRIKRFDWEINLNEGINNIDLIWDTEDTKEIRIDPKLGVQDVKGLIHISIREETIFMITAIGIYTSVTEKIKAHPFPAPIIKQLFLETPKMNLSTKIESVNLNSLKGLKIPLENLNAGISILGTLELPKFETKNSLIDSFDDHTSPSKDFAIHTIFKRIKNIINQS
jgi:serine/threonine protein kinase